jgi:heavy metal translocating P-type ATPase
MKQQFHIEGMTCATCQVTVQRAVAQLPGVKQVHVNLITHAMQVEFSDAVKPQTIIQEVKEAGYGAVAFDNNQPDQFKRLQKITRSMMKKRLWISFTFLFPLMYISMGIMLGLPLPNFLRTTLGNLGVQWALSFPIIIFNYRYFAVGMKRLFKLDPNMDTLVAIGTGAAILYGFYITVTSLYGLAIGDDMLAMSWMNQLYLESAGTILALVTLGKYLEELSKQKTLSALEKLMDLKPKQAWKKTVDGLVLTEVSLLEIGEIVLIKPGEMIPVDGTIIFGDTMVNQAAITGESLPVSKHVGDHVIGATMNQFGMIEVKVTAIGDDTTIAKIIHLVEEAALTKAPLAKLADEISKIFVPIVMIIALSMFILWLILGQPLSFAIQIMISVLVISCPCALGLATPVTMMVGTGKGAELGILVKSAEAMEKLNKVTTIVMDKTGTITQGKPIVVELINLSKDSDLTIKQLAGSLEQGSEHPLAKAIVEAMGKIPVLPVTDFVYIPGMGVRGKIDGQTYRLGKVNEPNAEIQQRLSVGKTVVSLTGPHGILAHFVIADALKPNSRHAMQLLKKMNKRLVMLTGDMKPVADFIAKDLSLDEVISDVLPQEKDSYISQFQQRGERVIMIGDGINDAPALMRADVGMAIGAGTDIAIEAADIVLLQSDLLQVVSSLQLARDVVKNMKLNLFWAFIYNLVAIPVAAGLMYPFFGWLLNPMIAAAAMALSSVSVVLNALRLRKFKPNIVK